MTEATESSSKKTGHGCCGENGSFNCSSMIEKMKDLCSSRDGSFNCEEIMQNFCKTDEKDK